MSGVVCANSADRSRVSKLVEAANGSGMTLTLISGFCFSNKATPFVRNDFASGTVLDDAASASFQIVIVVLPPELPAVVPELVPHAAVAKATDARSAPTTWPFLTFIRF